MASNTEAAKKRWQKISQEERSKKMSELVKIRWVKSSKKERKAHAMLMVEARRKKHA